MLAVLVLVAIGAYAYLYWWSRTPDHGFLDTIPVVHDASNKASKAVITPKPGAPAPGTGTVTPTEGNTTTPSTTYKTYESSETDRAYSFAYPDNWSVNQNRVNEVTTVCISNEGGDGGCLVSLTITKVDQNVNVGRTLEDLKAEFRKGSVKQSSRTIGGESAQVLKVSGYPADEQNSTRAAVFQKGEYVYVLETMPGREDMFDRVADSFLFRM